MLTASLQSLLDLCHKGRTAVMLFELMALVTQRCGFEGTGS